MVAHPKQEYDEVFSVRVCMKKNIKEIVFCLFRTAMAIGCFPAPVFFIKCLNTFILAERSDTMYIQKSISLIIFMLCWHSQGIQWKISMQQNNTITARDGHSAKSFICHVENLLAIYIHIYIYLIKIAEILKCEHSLFLLVKTNLIPSVIVIT